MRGVRYIGPIFDGSGYGAAARRYVMAIHAQGYPIAVTPIEFQEQKPDLGEQGAVLRELCARELDADKVILHSTPDVWAHHASRHRGKYLIGQTVWETSALHKVWVRACSHVNEVWVPSEWNVQVFRDSKVERPVHCIPHTVAPPAPAKPPVLEGVRDSDFVFYSIFEWTERKNPYALLAAYLSTFCGVRDVVLVLKTYQRADNGRESGGGPDIRTLIAEFKRGINLHHYPRIVVLEDLLEEEEIQGLHERGDCFVLLQRSEGWGLPHFEATTAGNPVVTPAFGGHTDFLPADASYLTRYTLRPVTGMPWSPYYQGTQYWCEPDLHHASELMRRVYDDPAEAKRRGAAARDYALERFNTERVGAMIVERLESIGTRADIHPQR